MNSPVVLVGLPRSGSTLLSRVMNESNNCFMINDFYYLQYVESVNGFEQPTLEIKRQLVDFILDQIRNRTKPPHEEDKVWFGLPFSEADIEKLFAFGEQYKAAPTIKSWSEILQDIMAFGSSLCGKATWGYNTPQDYLNYDRLIAAYPEAKFLFLLRSPARTLLSYKYYWTTEPKFKQDRGRYHPVVQSMAWRTCARSYLQLKAQTDNRCDLIKFEDLVKDTPKVLQQIHQLCGVDFPEVDISKFGNNSSFNKNGNVKQARVLTSLEESMCRKFTQKEAIQLGYDLPNKKKTTPSDVVDLLATTARNTRYYISKFVFSKNVRKRMIKFAQKLATTEPATS